MPRSGFIQYILCDLPAATRNGKTHLIPAGRTQRILSILQSPARTAGADAAELLNVSERSVATASRVLKSADEQVIAAVESGDVAVSDAAAVANRPKEEQRRALAATRQGRARTLRQAAELEGGGNSEAAESGEQGRRVVSAATNSQ